MDSLLTGVARTCCRPSTRRLSPGGTATKRSSNPSTGSNLAKTTVEDLKELGFDPFENPNIRVLNYLEITQRFIPNASIRLVDLHPAIRACLEAKTACQGWRNFPGRSCIVNATATSLL